MEFEIEIEDGEDFKAVIVDVDYAMEWEITHSGRRVWFCADWWVTHVDGVKVDKETAEAFAKRLDDEYVRDRIEEENSDD